jgi:hypothetical protein
MTALVAAVSLAAVASVAQADPAGKWRVQFGSSTSNDGSFTLRISPEGGTPVDVETKVTKGTGATTLARSVRDSLRASLGDGYDVETDDGQDVVIRAKGKTPKFDVTIAGSTLSGISVRYKKE